MPRPPVSFRRDVRLSTSPFRRYWPSPVPRHGPSEDAEAFRERATTHAAGVAEETRIERLVAIVVKKNGFVAGFPLRERLDRAARMFLALRVPGRQDQPDRFMTRSEKRARLDWLARELAAVEAGRGDRSEALGRLLVCNPFDLPQLPWRLEHCYLPGGLGGAQLPVSFTAEELVDLRRRVDESAAALTQLGPAAPVPGDGGLRMLVRDLATIWKEGTGRKASITRNGMRDGPGTRGGRYLRFLSWVVAKLGVRKSRMALARLHETWGK